MVEIFDASREFDRDTLINEVRASTSAAAGRPNFGDLAIDALSRLLPVDHLSVFVESDGEGGACKLAASRSDRSTSPKLARVYVERFFRQDPFRVATSGWTSGATVGRLHPDKLQDGPYRAECYDRPGITERVSVRSRQASNTCFFNFYRAHPAGPFSEDEIGLAITAASLLAPALARHSDSLSRGGDTRKALPVICERLQGIGHGLTRREIQVLGRGLIGMTMEGTALDLDVKMTSVATFRKRS